MKEENHNYYVPNTYNNNVKVIINFYSEHNIVNFNLTVVNIVHTQSKFYMPQRALLDYIVIISP